MKYLKTFENDSIFNIGDVVIVDIDDVAELGDILYCGGTSFTFYNVYILKDDDIYFIMHKDIIRKVSDEEAEEYRIKKESKKYNL